MDNNDEVTARRTNSIMALLIYTIYYTDEKTTNIFTNYQLEKIEFVSRDRLMKECYMTDREAVMM